MPVSHHIENYLCTVHVHYQVVRHPCTASACDAAPVPADALVKAVMLRDAPGHRFAMALVPASNRLELGWLPGRFAGMGFAREEDIRALFPGCVLEAIPGFGEAFELEMVWDEELLERSHLYFEGGDREALIRIGQDDFRDLFGRYAHGVISLPATTGSAGKAAAGVH